jgi:hypothetical protein
VGRWKPPKCKSGKVAYRTRGHAERALRRIRITNIQAVGVASKEPQRSYLCDCGAWHLTHRATGD